jgi:hypothetical protein
MVCKSEEERQGTEIFIWPQYGRDPKKSGGGKKKEEKEQEKNREIQRIASALKPDEIANYKKQFTVDELDRMARDQLILNGLSREEGEQQLPDLMTEHLTNRLARDKYNEQERVRAHSEDEGNQQDRQSEEELLAVIPDDVLEKMRGLSEQERNVCYARGKKALEGRFTLKKK